MGAKYKESPEFKWKNFDITMEHFKFIWYMEYGHRMWGRSIGAFFYLPAIGFWARGMLTPAIKKRVLLAGGLLGFQGTMAILHYILLCPLIVLFRFTRLVHGQVRAGPQ